MTIGIIVGEWAWGVSRWDPYNWLYAANHGYPFYLYLGAPDGSPIDPAQLKQYSVVWSDHGFEFIISLLIRVLKPFGLLPTAGFSVNAIDYVLPTIYVCTGASLLFVNASIAFIALCFIGLLLTIFAVNLGLVTGSDLRSSDAVALAFCCLVLVRVVTAGWQRWDWPFYLLVGIGCGWMTMFRHTTLYVVFLINLIFVLLALAAVLAYRSQSWRRALAALVPGPLLVLGGLLLVRTFARLVYVQAGYDALPEHESGVGLYLSLGWVANPYGIAWEDEVAFINFGLFADRAHEFTNYLQSVLQQQYYRLVLEDPLLFFRNVLGRAVDLNEYLLTSRPALAHSRDIAPNVGQSPMHIAFYALWWTFMIFVLGQLILVRSMRWPTFGLAITGLACAVGAFASPLLGMPLYYASVVALNFITAVVLAPFYLAGISLASPVSSNDAQKVFPRIVSRQVRGRLAVGVLVMLLLLVAFTAVRELMLRSNAAQVAHAEDPLALLRQEHERFSYLFNRLAADDQQRILERIARAGETEPDVFCAKSDWTIKGIDSRIFVPTCLVITRPLNRTLSRAHVFAYLSSRWRPPSPPADQGPAGSWITVEGSECQFPRMWYQHDRCLYLRIADANWQGRYYAFVLPVNAQFGADPCGYVIGAYDLVAIPGGSENRKFASDKVVNERAKLQSTCR